MANCVAFTHGTESTYSTLTTTQIRYLSKTTSLNILITIEMWFSKNCELNDKCVLKNLPVSTFNMKTLQLTKSSFDVQILIKTSIW